MKWFRFYTESLNSKKVQDLSPVLFKFWINLLALANDQAPRGSLPSDEEIAFRLRMPVKKVSHGMNELTGRGLVDDSGDMVSMHNWENWQRGSDHAAERMRNKRRTSSEHVPNKFAPDKKRLETEQTRDRTEAEAENLLPLLTEHYENEIGSLTPMIEDELREWAKEIPDERFITFAFKESSSNGARNWKYVASILTRLKDEEWPIGGERGAEQQWLEKRYARSGKGALR